MIKIRKNTIIEELSKIYKREIHPCEYLECVNTFNLKTQDKPCFEHPLSKSLYCTKECMKKANPSTNSMYYTKEWKEKAKSLTNRYTESDDNSSAVVPAETSSSSTTTMISSSSSIPKDSKAEIVPLKEVKREPPTNSTFEVSQRLDFNDSKNIVVKKEASEPLIESTKSIVFPDETGTLQWWDILDTNRSDLVDTKSSISKEQTTLDKVTLTGKTQKQPRTTTKSTTTSEITKVGKKIITIVEIVDSDSDSDSRDSKKIKK